MYIASIVMGFVIIILFGAGWHYNYNLRIKYANELDESIKIYHRSDDRLREYAREYERKCDQYKELLVQNGRLLKERDEARSVAEKFLEKYLTLKTAQDARVARANEYMKDFNSNVRGHVTGTYL